MGEKQKKLPNDKIPTTDRAKKSAKKKEYCSKADMMVELRIFKKDGVITEKLGQMFTDIATKYAHRLKFSGYTEIQDFVHSAIHRMVEQIDKFDPEHPKANPFGYFTTIAHRKFLTEIKKFNSYLQTKKVLSDNFMENLQIKFNLPTQQNQDEEEFLDNDKLSDDQRRND